jgi:hypothetical protein
VSVGVRQPVSRWKRWVWRAGLVLSGFIILLTVWRLTLDRLIAAELAGIHEKSYPVTLAELNRWYPRVPPGENRAIVLGKAFDSLSREADLSRPVRDKTVVPSPQSSFTTDPQERTVEDYLNENGEALALLHQASDIPRSRFPINLSTLSILPYPHLGNLLSSARLLKTEAANHAECASPQLAIASVQSLFALSQSLVKEPLVRSHLARIDCQGIAVGGLQNLLSNTGLTDAQLEGFGSALAKADDQRGLARAFIGQRCIGIRGFDMMRETMDLTALPVAHSLPLGQRIFVNLNVLFSSPAYLYDLSGLLQWDELSYLRLMDRYVQTAQMAFPERIGAAQALRHSLERQGQLHALSRVWLRGMNGSRIILKDATVAATLRTARVAVAIERFRLARGQLPRTLVELDPFGMRAMPDDPFNGRPLRYKKLAKGYVVYSVGEDGKNDDGDEKKDVTFIVER